MTQKKVLGIIGIGPRGLSALENFVIAIQGLSEIQIVLFEETGQFGNGQVYDLNQSSSNWMNVSERVLSLEKRALIHFESFSIPEFPSFQNWLSKNQKEIASSDSDYYPPRAKIGKYLNERFQSLIKPLQKADMVTLVPEAVTEIKIQESGKVLITSSSSRTFDQVDEVLLTVGHQSTKFGKQIQAWQQFASNKKAIKLFTAPYPIHDFLDVPQLTENAKIGIRGFGLAMIDVARAIAEKFGDFVTDDTYTKACHYSSNAASQGMLIPFSLDGLPPAPKPLNKEIDDWFKPTENERLAFERQIGDRKIQAEAQSPLFLIEAFAALASKIYLALPNVNIPDNFTVKDVESVIKSYLEDQEYQHSTLLSQKQATVNIMEKLVAMATGKEAISLDYCIGQVWRFCQPSIYVQLSFNACSVEVFADIIALDESTKRYSYGPPVESIHQMLALEKAGFMNLEMANNPDFKLKKDGWQMTANNKSLTAEIMIDSVLDPPKIKVVNSPLIEKLLSSDLIQAIHDDLGIETDENAYIKSKNEKARLPIALLGRLAKGTIIGVDAIAECFGIRPKNWAKQAAKRFI